MRPCLFAPFPVEARREVVRGPHRYGDPKPKRSPLRPLRPSRRLASAASSRFGKTIAPSSPPISIPPKPPRSSGRRRVSRGTGHERRRPVDLSVEECDATAVNSTPRVHVLTEGSDMRRNKLSMIAACALIGLVAAGARLYGQQKTGAVADRAADFSGKVVHVDTNDGFSVPLSDARIKEVGGRSFVIGQVPSDIRIGGTFSGSTLWVPLNDVTRMGEFGTLEEWHRVRK